MKKYFTPHQYRTAILGVLALPVIYFISRYSYNLFHSFADGLSIVIAVCAFAIIWNSRRFVDNDYFLYTGIAFLFFAFLDLMHLLGNKNMGIFPGYGNLGPAFYIASRYVLSVSLLIAPFFINRKLNATLMFAVYSLVTSLILLSIFYWQIFPVTIVEGVGLTPFKVVSDYIICLILLGAVSLMLINRRSFNSRVLRLIVSSIILSIATGLTFTLYVDPFGITNLVGHLFQIASFYLLYLAFIQTGLTNPQEILFRKLKQHEENLTKNLQRLDDTNIELKQEIAERKRMETALRKSEERYHNLFNTMDEGFCIIEMIFDGEDRPVDYRFLEVNAAFEKQTGLHDVKDKLIRDLLPDNEEYWFEIYGKIALTGEPLHFGNEVKALNRWYDVYAYRVGEPENRQVAIIFNDITDRKRIEENLRSAHDDLEVRVQERTFELSEAYETLQKEVDEHKKTAEQLVRVQKLEALGTLAGGIAHDFNNILAGLIGFTEMVLEDIAPDTPEHRRLELVLKGANRGRDLVRQILTFSRKSEQDKKPLALNQVVEEGLKLLRPTLPTTIEIVSKSLTNDDQIFADPVQMHQILMNLCTNAAHAMREKGGTLDIRVFKTSLQEGNRMPLPNMKAGEYVVLKVSDTGSGMTPETLNQVFDPFFTTKQPGEGTGLGLSVVHGIVKSHDGYIAIESELEKGTAFHIYLPSIKEEARSIDKETLPVTGGKEHMLIVDDEDMLVELSEQRLRRLGYEVVATTSSTEALAIFRKEPDTFDLVITDYTMPNMTGTDLAIELLKVRATIPIILCTGQSDTISPEKAKEIGIRGFLMKPLTNRELAQAVRRVLDEKRDPR
jgi:PAS domain S-box-containing protein